MSIRKPRCLVHVPVGPPRPVKSLKFGVTTRDGLALSGIWTVTPHSNRRKPDVFVTATGLYGASKFSFHADVLNHAWLNEKHEMLVQEGIAPAGPRRWQHVPIGDLPWHGLTVRFPGNMLRKMGHSLEDVSGDIVSLPPPADNEVLDIGFILASGTGLNVHQAQFSIGEVGGGGRACLVVGRYSKQETAKQKNDYRTLLSKIQVAEKVLKNLSPDDDLAALLFGEEGGALIVTEVHNVRANPRQDRS